MRDAFAFEIAADLDDGGVREILDDEPYLVEAFTSAGVRDGVDVECRRRLDVPRVRRRREIVDVTAAEMRGEDRLVRGRGLRCNQLSQILDVRRCT